MIVKEFPDINWLRRQSNSNFSNRRDSAGNLHDKAGWPNVLLNTSNNGTARSGIKGPYSIFMNLQGKSIIRSEGKAFSITEKDYCITNAGQYYDLIIPEHSSTVTFNLHFSESLFNEVSQVLTKRTTDLLDDPFNSIATDLRLVPHTRWKTESMREGIQKLKLFYEANNKSIVSYELEEEVLSVFLSHHLEAEVETVIRMQALSSLKNATKLELFKRALTARDYIHGVFPQFPTLNELSKVALLSKFHLQRTFQAIFGYTPLQYVSKLKLERSTQLLRKTDHTITEISFLVGFSDLPSFHRFFKRHLGTSPKQFRDNN